jgi:hypothetical protein
MAIAKSGTSVLVCALFLAQLTVAHAQGGAQDEKLSLNLISPPVKPGAPVYLNAMFSNPSGAPVFEIRQTIQFPREKLVLSRARLGTAGDLAGAVLTVDMKDKSGVKVQDREAAETLELRITAQKPLQDGPLVELQFRLIDDKEQSIRLAHIAEALNSEGNKVPELAFSDTEVVVTAKTGPEAPAVFACFFYMH